MRKFICTVMFLSLSVMLIGGLITAYVNSRNMNTGDSIAAANIQLLPDGSVDIEIAGEHLRTDAEIDEELYGYLFAICPESLKTAIELLSAAAISQSD